MAVLETNVGTDHEAAARLAERERRDVKPFATGQALSNDEQEVARNRRLAGLDSPLPASDIDPRRSFRAPASERVGDDAVEPGAAPSLPPQEQTLHSGEMQTLYTPPHERTRPAPSPQMEEAAPVAAETQPDIAPEPPSDESFHRFESEIMGTPPVADGIPDQMIDVNGQKIPLSRILAGDQALRNKMQADAELTQRNQAMTRAWQNVMSEVRQGLIKDPVQALRNLGASDYEIKEAFARGGVAVPGMGASATPQVTTLPDDADPLAKALFAENQRARQQIGTLSQQVSGLAQSMEQERAQRSAQAAEAAKLATLSGEKSNLMATALRSSSMRDAAGKLSREGRLLVETTMKQIELEVQSGLSQDPASVRQRALQVFLANVKEHGVPSKADQARNSLERPKTPVPARAGTTRSDAVHPGSSTTRTAPPGQRASFDWTDDEQRRAAMRVDMDKLLRDMS